MVQALLQALPVLHSCFSPAVSSLSSSRGMPGKIMVKSSIEQPPSSKLLTRHVLSGLAASLIFISQINQAVAADVPHQGNICQLASAASNLPPLPLDENLDKGGGRLMMMRGMTAKDFDPVKYSGRWFEVASLKRGFAGQGQEDCHCTQGVYTFDMEAPSIQVDTFCVHGGPDGYITGIRGKVQCLSEYDLEKNETQLEKQEMIKEKCFLRFPTLPFIPKEPYDVIATDYDNFALVSGAKDRSFIQIYSRTPDPGPKFIEKYKSYLANFGYDPSKIKDTPQDCQVMSNSQLAAMMSMSGMQQALTNQFPDLGLNAPIEFNPFTSVFDTLKKLVELYFK
ncbi:Invertebrate colouration protein [Parasponia andersonii]|uniref:Invertebrate colouration protein n=1 Tax=Parasponia andersonii TaxID=3476 RepID=A0A2P5BS26_PARAD|nr:Invertebrate colouration protein [Parasponia andersonii]